MYQIKGYLQNAKLQRNSRAIGKQKKLEIIDFYITRKLEISLKCDMLEIEKDEKLIKLLNVVFTTRKLLKREISRIICININSENRK